MSVSTWPQSEAHRIYTVEQAGPAYVTGGYVLDLRGRFSKLEHLDVRVVAPGANLPACQFEVALNTPTDGQATIKINSHAYDRLTAIGGATGAPAGVTVETVGSKTLDAEAAHTHDSQHDHAVTPASSGPGGGAGGVATTAISPPNLSTHTHIVNLPNLALTSGAGASHTHVIDTIYEHQHALTNTATDSSLVQLANALDLSGATLRYYAEGV